MKQEVMVSVLCATYNQEKYIKKCLDSILMQETDFRFEILVHDDNSSDRTGEILEEYKMKYPDIVKTIVQNENQYRKGIRIQDTIMLPKACGKYLALCDGDDYWTDPFKLQKQVDVMQKHPECSICVCKVNMVDEAGYDLHKTIPDAGSQFTEGVLLREEFAKLLFFSGYAFQTSGYFLKREVLEKIAVDFQESPIGGIEYDIWYLRMAAFMGELYYLPDVMVSYRVNAIGSYNRDMKPKTEQEKANQKREYIDKCVFFDVYTKHCFKYYIDISICMAHLRVVCFEKKETERKKYLKKAKSVLKNKTVPLTYRRKLLLWYISPKLLILCDQLHKKMKK